MHGRRHSLAHSVVLEESSRLGATAPRLWACWTRSGLEQSPPLLKWRWGPRDKTLPSSCPATQERLGATELSV